jgi:hypothetical protein
MKTIRRQNFIATLCAASLALLALATTAHAQSVETGIVKLADSSIEYFSRLLPDTEPELPARVCLPVDRSTGRAN